MSLLSLWLNVLPRLNSARQDPSLSPGGDSFPAPREMSRSIGQNPAVAVGVAVAAGVVVGCLLKR